MIRSEENKHEHTATTGPILRINNTVYRLAAVPVPILNKPNQKVSAKLCPLVACGASQYFQGRNIFQTNVFRAESASDSFESYTPTRRNDRMTEPSPLHSFGGRASGAGCGKENRGRSMPLPRQSYRCNAGR
jgi:hypothetical protein